MSIVAHLPRLDPLTGSRLGGASPVDSSEPPKELLPDGGSLAPAPAPAPERVLARDALRLIRLARTAGPAAIPWSGNDLPAEIEDIRRQLVPIRSRRSLSASYRREALNRGGIQDLEGRRSGVVRLAYTLRWLELGPDRA
jgi:hypothetical protein